MTRADIIAVIADERRAMANEASRRQAIPLPDAPSPGLTEMVFPACPPPVRAFCGEGVRQPDFDPLEAVLRPIVEGQLRSFANDHPRVIEAVDWFKPRKSKRDTFVNSVAKRIIRDLLCAETRVRLGAALVAISRDGAVLEGGGTAPAARGCVSKRAATAGRVASDMPAPNPVRQPDFDRIGRWPDDPRN